MTLSGVLELLSIWLPNALSAGLFLAVAVLTAEAILRLISRVPRLDTDGNTDIWSSLHSLPSPETEVAMRRAQERRQAIARVLGSSEGSSIPGILNVEFLETPPGRESSASEFTDGSAEAIAQTVRLRWQLESDELLLADRVVDLLVGIRREGRRDLGGFPFAVLDSAVKLVHEETLLGAGRFPWIVVIETDHPGLYSKTLQQHSDWLGIGVRFERKSAVHLQGQCQVGTGMKGVLGGVLRSSVGTFAMTCAHVLSPECQSVAMTASSASSESEPDAALIRLGSSCFAAPQALRQCVVASDAAVRNAYLRRQFVHKGRQPKKRGYISSRAVEVEAGGKMFRFPHIQIVPLRIPVLGRLSAIFVRAFSRGGDSGSWVFNDETGDWLGMIVAGDEDQRLSYAAEAGPLLEYFRLRLGDPQLSAYE